MRPSSSSPLNRSDAAHALYAAAVLVATALLAACGGGGGGGGGTSAGNGGASATDLASRDYLPLQVGNRWIYRRSDSSGDASVTERLTANASVGSATGFVEHSSDPNDSDTVLVADAQGVRQFPSAAADPLTTALGPVQLLRYPLRVGDSFLAVDKSIGAVADIDGDGLGDPVKVHADTTVVALESVVASAGTFAECVHLRTDATLVVQSSALGRSVTIHTITDDWLAPGIGPVRSNSIVSTTGNGSDFSDSTSQSITAYGVGSLHSDSVAPTASASGLDGTAPLRPDARVAIAFSEDMDTTTLADSLHVVDAIGHPVVGTVTVVDARDLQFIPSTPFGSGTYTAQLDGAATDLVGNPVAGVSSWTFNVDATAPSIVQSQPLQGTVDVAVASSVVVTFSEPVDPATVSASTLPLLTGVFSNAAADYAVSGAVVTITPQAPLARGTDYRLAVRGVTDLTGNPAYGQTVAFRTDPGRFDFGRSLAADGISPYTAPMSAVGDLNGDGRADVAVTSIVNIGSNQTQTVVSAYLQQADGTLSAAVPVATLPSDCDVTSLAIGDIGGDGRNALVVARPGSCASIVYRLAAGGTFVADAGTTPAWREIRLADLDGDGHVELISSNGYDGTLQIWSLTGNAWTLRTTFAVTAGRIAIGDLNGDGLADIAFVRDGGAYFQAFTAGVIYQMAGGGFGSPQLLQTQSDGFFPHGSIAIADLDADGRNDLVVATGRSISAFQQDAAGRLGPEQILVGGYLPSPVAVADLNGDGRADLIYALDQTGLKVRLQQADGSFAPPAGYSPDAVEYPVNVLGSLVVADVNGDGRPDVLLNGNLYLQRPVPVMSESIGGRHAPARSTLQLRRTLHATLSNVSRHGVSAVR